MESEVSLSTRQAPTGAHVSLHVHVELTNTACYPKTHAVVVILTLLARYSRVRGRLTDYTQSLWSKRIPQGKHKSKQKWTSKCLVKSESKIGLAFSALCVVRVARCTVDRYNSLIEVAWQRREQPSSSESVDARRVLG